MSHSEAPQERPFDAERYEIRIKGHLDARWAGRFDGLALTCESGGTTLLQTPEVDQAALHGLLQQVRDIGLPLVSVTRIEPDPASGVPIPGHRQPPSEGAVA